MTYGDFKELNRRTFADKVLRDEAFHIVKNSRYVGYQRGLASMVYKCFDNKTSDSCIKDENIPNKELTKELHKSIIRNFN